MIVKNMMRVLLFVLLRPPLLLLPSSFVFGLSGYLCFARSNGNRTGAVCGSNHCTGGGGDANYCHQIDILMLIIT